MCPVARNEESSGTSPVIPLIVGLLGVALGVLVGITQGGDAQSVFMTAIALGIVGFLLGFGVAKVLAMIRNR